MDSMDGQARREEILRRLGEGSAPVSAASLARTLGVSRQVIVGDVARPRTHPHACLYPPSPGDGGRAQRPGGHGL